MSLEDVLKVLQPLWSTKTRTGVAIRPRIEAVLGYAIVKGWRSAPNVAAWGSNLEHLLSAPSKIAPTEHFKALDWRLAPDVYKALRDHPSGLATRLALLTAARPSEVCGMPWEEVDLSTATWTIPPERTKSRRGHRVPLSVEAVAILKQVQEETGRKTGLIWLGSRSGRQLTDLALRQPLRDASGDPEVTLHGSARSSFRDWARDNRHDEGVAEMALAHSVGNATVKAYARSDLFDARRELMQAWADHLTGVVKPASDESVEPVPEAVE